ncbi:MAG: hypothetical protein ACYSWU_26905 [Planctomycetota bacterium]|jgi:hypothetical protein
MTWRLIHKTLTIAALLTASTAYYQEAQAESSWQQEFDIANCELLTTGRNQYFILEPGHQIVLEGDDTKVEITVLDETETVDGIVTRIVEEREWEDGELFEISRNYFAICNATNDIFYFGEAVDYYEDGEVVKHEGEWLAGSNGNKAGLIMPGSPMVGMKYYQEIAPGVALDRAEIVSLDETCETPAGTFANCLKVKEGTGLNAFETEYKYYAPDIGLIQDEDILLTKFGTVTLGE